LKIQSTFEARMVEQVLDVATAAGEVVIEADDVVPGRDQAVAEMGAEEAGPTGDEDALLADHHIRLRPDIVARAAGDRKVTAFRGRCRRVVPERASASRSAAR
jgi:hypothetical protein